MAEQGSVEVVIFTQPLPVKLTLSLPAPCALSAFLARLPSEFHTPCRDLQATRYGKRIDTDALIMPGDQIAWLPPVAFDPKLSRQARVEKQRKDRRRLRVQAFQAASLAARTKKASAEPLN
jgi:hypothetical protein